MTLQYSPAMCIIIDSSWSGHSSSIEKTKAWGGHAVSPKPQGGQSRLESWWTDFRVSVNLCVHCTASKVLSKGPHPVSHVLLGTSFYKSGVYFSNTIHFPSPRSADTSQLVIWKLRSPQQSWTWNPTYHFVFTACYPLPNWAFWISVSFTVCVRLPSWLPPAKWCLRCPLQCIFQTIKTVDLGEIKWDIKYL